MFINKLIYLFIKVRFDNTAFTNKLKAHMWAELYVTTALKG